MQNWIWNYFCKIQFEYDSTLFVWNNTQIHGPVWFHVRSSSCSDFNPHLRITVWRRLPFDFQFLKPRENFWKALYVHFSTLPVNSFANLKKAFCLLTTSFGKVMKVWKKILSYFCHLIINEIKAQVPFALFLQCFTHEYLIVLLRDLW